MNSLYSKDQHVRSKTLCAFSSGRGNRHKVAQLRRFGTKIIDKASDDTISHVQMTLKLLFCEAKSELDAFKQEVDAPGIAFQVETGVACISCEEHTMDRKGDYLYGTSATATHAEQPCAKKVANVMNAT